MQFLIGNDGRRWLPFGREFTGYFGFSGTWEETLDHAVRSLGQVSLHISPRRCRVRLRPEALTWGAFQQLISVLLDDERKPVVLEIVGAAASPTELYVRPDDAIARIDDLRAMNRRTGGPQWRASFIDEPLSLHRLKLDSAPGLRAAHRDWIRRRGRIDRATLRKLLDAPLSAPLLLARIGRDGRPVSETWPRHLAIYGEEQARKLIGRPFDEHPLHAYTMRATKGYRDTDRAQAPRLDLIEAVVRPEDSPTVRLRYERLLLPWRGEDGTRFVASLSHSIWRRASACPVC
jgi:hypothetical protein